jgi:hypothetical protein
VHPRVKNLAYLFFCFDARVGGGEIRTCDLRFIKRGSQPIELPLGKEPSLPRHIGLPFSYKEKYKKSLKLSTVYNSLLMFKK